MARKEQENPALDMTPMIDVVFELMIFFVVTLKQEDILSKLAANRPAPNTNKNTVQQNDNSITIQIGVDARKRDAYIYNNSAVTLPQLDANIRQNAKISKDAIITVKCALDSRHRGLVKVLDICNKNGMNNVCVLSM